MRIDWVKMGNARDYANKNIKTKCKKKSFWLWKKERNLIFNFISFSSTPKFCPCWGPGDAAFDPSTFSLFYLVLSYIFLFYLVLSYIFWFYLVLSYICFGDIRKGIPLDLVFLMDKKKKRKEKLLYTMKDLFKLFSFLYYLALVLLSLFF
jgi:hypothetical protein